MNSIIYQLGTTSMFYKFGNDAASLKKYVPDKNERSFLTKITKKVFSQNVSYIQGIRGSTTRLSKLNPHRKEKVFVQGSEMFFFFTNPAGAQNIEKDMQKTLSEKVHFKFSEAAAKAIARLVSKLLKDPSQSDRDEYLIQQVLSSSGVLLDLNCKICLQIISPKVYYSYLNPTPSQNESFADRPGSWFYFVGVFFATTVINHPPFIERQENSSKANDAYRIVERQLMDFIKIDTPDQYSVVFAKFSMLFLRQYEQYKFRYLDRQLSKEGFFDSIGGFFSRAASVVSSVVGTATSAVSTAMDVYQNTIKPIAQTLTPILTPFLPGSVGTVLKMVAQNSAFTVEEDQVKNKESNYLKSFRNTLSRVDVKRQGVDYLNWSNIFEYLVVVRLSVDGKVSESYTGVLINKDIILTQIPEQGQNLNTKDITFQCSFFQEGDYKTENWIKLTPLTKSRNKYYYFKLDKEVKDFTSRYQLDFVKNHVSSAAFHQYMADKDIFMLSYKKDILQPRELVAQVSKILKSTDEHFLEAFQKFEGCMGSPIFYIDKKTKKNVIIGTCTQDIKELDFISILKNDLSKEELEKAKSAFLVPSAFISTYLPAETGKSQNADFDQGKVLKDLTIERNSLENLGKYENLRSQLGKREASKPSFVALVGIIKIETVSGDRYGVGVKTAKNTLLTLRKYVPTGNGSVFLRRNHYEFKQLDFDIDDPQKFDKFTIKHVNLSDSDFVTIEYLDEEERKDEIQINYIRKQGLSHPKIAGYFLEFDFNVKSGGKTKIHLEWKEISTEQMRKQKINSSRISDTTQRLYFAYQRKGVSKDSLNEYIFGISNPDANKINYLYEETFLTTTDKEGKKIENSTLATQQKIIFSDRRRPLYQPQQVKPYEAIGIIMHRKEPRYPQQFSGTGTLIEVTISLGQKDYTLKNLYMITCAHNFIFLSNDKVYDLSDLKEKGSYLFQHGITKSIDSIDDFLQRFQNPNEPNVSKNFARVVTPKEYRENLLSSGANKKDETTYDIAIVKLSSQPATRPKAFKLQLNKRYSTATLSSMLEKDAQKIRLTGFPGSESNWQSRLGIMYTESVGQHSKFIKQEERKSFVQVFDHKIKHKLSSLGGNSGSALILQDNVIGIHTTGIPKRNSIYGSYNLATSVYEEVIYNWLVQYFTEEANAELAK